MSEVPPHWPPLRDGVDVNNLEPNCYKDELGHIGVPRPVSWIAELVQREPRKAVLSCAGQHGTPVDARECARRHIASLKAAR